MLGRQILIDFWFGIDTNGKSAHVTTHCQTGGQTREQFWPPSGGEDVIARHMTFKRMNESQLLPMPLSVQN